MNNKNAIDNINFNWKCKKTWIKSAKNTAWCLLGCSIGDFGTILFFQFSETNIPAFQIMALAIINGLITSILLETFILLKQMDIKKAFKLALTMSFVSMISMEIAMNLIDYILLGEARLVWWIVPIMLFAGFVTPWPYNYWNLKKYNISCH